MKNEKQKNEFHTIRKETTTVLIAGAAGCIALFSVVASFNFIQPLLLGIIVLIIYCALCIAAYFMYERRDIKKSDDDELLAPVMGKIMFDAVVKMSSPVFICDGGERIIWYNTATEELFTQKNKIHGTSVADMFGVTLSDIRNERGESGCKLKYGGRTFAAKYNHIKTGDDNFALIITTETTDLDGLCEKMEGDELVVSYIIIDNMNEMMQYDSEQYRPASTKIDEILRTWADEFSSILKEYERDKYIFITNMRTLGELIAGKFEILDRVRGVKVGDTNLPLTVSIGISGIHGSFEDKEKAAHAALDMALQRGGDQAAVKTDESMDFYGGVTKTVQKRTNVRARVVSNELMASMKSSTNVLIMGHKYADFDAFGACVGLARIAMFCGARVNIVINTADRNLIKCRAMLEPEEDFLGIFVNSETALDMLETGTLVIVADVNNLSIAEEPELCSRTEKLAVIDHHRKASEYSWEPDIEYIEPSASSTCELVAEMLEQVLPRDDVSVPEANVMLAGITLDTKQFTKNAGTRTFSAAMYLRDRGANPADVQDMFRQSFEDYRKEAKFRKNVEIYRGVCAITIVGDLSGSDNTADATYRVIAAKAADNLLTVDGIKASFAVIKLGDTVHISARSSGGINVQLIMEEMGGGGHFDGAAAQSAEHTMDETIVILKQTIDKYI